MTYLLNTSDVFVKFVVRIFLKVLILIDKLALEGKRLRLTFRLLGVDFKLVRVLFLAFLVLLLFLIILPLLVVVPIILLVRFAWLSGIFFLFSGVQVLCKSAGLILG